MLLEEFSRWLSNLKSEMSIEFATRKWREICINIVEKIVSYLILSKMNTRSLHTGSPVRRRKGGRMGNRKRSFNQFANGWDCISTIVIAVVYCHVFSYQILFPLFLLFRLFLLKSVDYLDIFSICRVCNILYVSCNYSEPIRMTVYLAYLLCSIYIILCK